MNKAYTDAISKNRLSPYRKACNGNIKLAIALYEKNILMNKHFFEYLGRFEILLRNHINKRMILKFGDKWCFKQWGNHSNISSSLNEAESKLKKKYPKRSLNNDDVVASLTFGFWSNLFNKYPQQELKKLKFNVVDLLPSGVDRKEIFKELAMVNNIRNRMAHHEPLIIKNGKIDYEYIQDLIAISQKYFKDLDVDHSKIRLRLDFDIYSILEDIINIENSIPVR